VSLGGSREIISLSRQTMFRTFTVFRQFFVIIRILLQKNPHYTTRQYSGIYIYSVGYDDDMLGALSLFTFLNNSYLKRVAVSCVSG